MRNWPVRRQIIAALALPMLVLTGLMAEISIIRLTEARAAAVAGNGANWLANVNELIRALQAERLASASQVASGDPEDDSVARAAARVDDAWQRVGEATQAMDFGEQAAVAQAVASAQQAMRRLGDVRADRAAERLDPLSVSQPYSDMITAWLVAEDALTRDIVPTSVGAAAPAGLADAAAALSAIACANEHVSG